MDDFDALWDVWPGNRRGLRARKDAEEAFAESAPTADVFAEMVRRAKLVAAGLLPGDHPGMTLARFIRGAWESIDLDLDPEPAPSVSSAVVQSPAPSPPAEVDQRLIDSGFATVADFWIPNPDFPESRERQLAAWREARARGRRWRPLVEACRAYSQWIVDAGQSYPKHLAKFLGDDATIDAWLARAAGATAPSDEEAFEVAWRLYPAFVDKQLSSTRREALVVWRRDVGADPEDRLAFIGLCLVQRAAARSGRQVAGIRRIIPDWRERVGRASDSEVCRVVARPLCELVASRGGTAALAGAETTVPLQVHLAMRVRPKGQERVGFAAGIGAWWAETLPATPAPDAGELLAFLNRACAAAAAVVGSNKPHAVPGPAVRPGDAKPPAVSR